MKFKLFMIKRHRTILLLWSWILVSALFCVEPLKATTNINVTSMGPGAGTAVIVADFDPSDANIACVGGDCQGIIRTLDGGASWAAPNQGLINASDPFYEAYYVLEIEVDPVMTTHIYAGTQRGIYKSLDQGTTWTKLDIAALGNTGLGNHTPIGSIEVDPADNSIVYAGFGDN